MGEHARCSLDAITNFGKGELTRFDGAARFLAFETEIWGSLPGMKTPRGRQAVVAFLFDAGFCSGNLPPGAVEGSRGRAPPWRLRSVAI
jgi:hypothetical protein